MTGTLKRMLMLPTTLCIGNAFIVVDQGTPCVDRYEIGGRQADYRSFEKAYTLNYTSRKEKLRNEILWDEIPPAGSDR
ncbi:hypothetical protein EAE96_007110 [Botrytis aclada]|nr:hypothetical protein EAE96_007110 [Botrytis aclada]